MVLCVRSAYSKFIKSHIDCSPCVYIYMWPRIRASMNVPLVWSLDCQTAFDSLFLKSALTDAWMLDSWLCNKTFVNSYTTDVSNVKPCIRTIYIWMGSAVVSKDARNNHGHVYDYGMSHASDLVNIWKCFHAEYKWRAGSIRPECLPFQMEVDHCHETRRLLHNAYLQQWAPSDHGLHADQNVRCLSCPFCDSLRRPLTEYS